MTEADLRIAAIESEVFRDVPGLRLRDGAIDIDWFIATSRKSPVHKVSKRRLRNDSGRTRDWRARLATTDNAREWLERLGVTEDAPDLDAHDMGTIDFSGLFDALVDADVAAADVAAEAVAGMVALPLDAECVPINVGDTIAKREIPKGAVVYRMSITKDGWRIDLKSNKSSASFPDVEASKCWHVEAQPTLAQILAEYGAAYADAEDKGAVTSECEAKVREAVNAGR